MDNGSKAKVSRGNNLRVVYGNKIQAGKMGNVMDECGVESKIGHTARTPTVLTEPRCFFLFFALVC